MAKTVEEIIKESEGYELKLGNNVDPEEKKIHIKTEVVKPNTNEKETLDGTFVENKKYDRKAAYDQLKAHFMEMFQFDDENKKTGEKLFKSFFTNPAFAQKFANMEAADEELLNNLATAYNDSHNEEINNNELFQKKVNAYFESFLPKNASEELKNQMHEMEQNDDFMKNMVSFCRETASYFSLCTTMDTAKIKDGCGPEERSAAMSSVAKLLGRGDLIADTTKMTIVQNGDVKEGFFTKDHNASLENKYEDLNHLNNDSKLENVVLDVDYEPAMKGIKDVADLQIIDYICGNVNRTLENMQYQTVSETGYDDDEDKETVMFHGVVGINNGCSFGEITGDENNNIGTFVKLEDLRVMSGSMRNSVMQVTQEQLTQLLKGYQLSEKEIGAACKRLENLQNLIKDVETPRNDIKNNKDVKKEQINILIVPENHKEGIDDYQIWNDEINNFEATFIGGKHKSNRFDDIKDLMSNNVDERMISSYVKKSGNKQALTEWYGFDLGLGKPVDPINAHLMQRNDFSALKLQDKVLDNLYNEMENAYCFTGTKYFTDIQDALVETRGLLANQHNDLEVNKLTAWTDVYKSYETLGKTVDVYLKKKENEAKTKELSKTAKKRVRAAEKIKRYAAKQMDSMYLTKDDLNRYVENMPNIMGQHHFDIREYSSVRVAIVYLEQMKNKPDAKLSFKDFYESMEKDLQTKEMQRLAIDTSLKDGVSLNYYQANEEYSEIAKELKADENAPEIENAMVHRKFKNEDVDDFDDEPVNEESEKKEEQNNPKKEEQNDLKKDEIAPGVFNINAL